MKQLVLKLPENISNDILQDLEVCFAESKWIMNGIFALTVVLFTAGHILLTLYLLKREQIISLDLPCIDRDGYYRLDESDDDY